MANNTQDRDIQVAISFDTSGSMHHAIEEVRSRISQMIRQLKAGIPGIEFAVIAHGGYFDENNDYSVRGVNFTSDEEHVADFVNNVENTVGDVEPECYELMLWLVDQRLTWKSSSEKVLVVIGDSYPHALDDPQNKYGLDWKEEARRLVAKVSKVILEG
nr:hypothetical protein BaRGS_020043 [Batillaria attramentaria]